MNRRTCFLFVLGLILIATAVPAEPAAAPAAALDGGAPAVASPPLGEAAASTPATGACAAKSAVASFSEYPTCGQCSNDGCRGEYVGTICGLDQFGQLMVCQDQLTGCYPRPYPDTIFCRCTSDIVP